MAATWNAENAYPAHMTFAIFYMWLQEKMKDVEVDSWVFPYLGKPCRFHLGPFATAPSSVPLRSLAILLMLFLSILIITPGSTQADSDDVYPKPGDIEKVSAILLSSARFQEVARADYVKALLAYTKNMGIEKLHTIDSELWEPEQSQIAWMLFFNSAIRVPAGQGSVPPLIGYYNPYSDVFLITAWAPEDGLYKIVDAELLMGDWVRKGDRELDVAPLWLRETTYPPAALGVSIARSVKAFEDAFASAGSSDWRHELPILEEPDALQDLNYSLAALMMVNQQINVIDFSSPDPEDQQKVRLRDLTVSIIDMASNGAIENVLSSAKETPEEVNDTLRTFPPDWFSTLKVASVYTASDGFLVLLSSTEKNASLVLFFEEEDTGLKMSRIDLISYQNFYTYFKAKND